MDRISEFENIMHSIMNDKSIENLIDLGFLKAPASTKYHYSFEGGLYEHSFNVMRALQNLTDRLNLEWQRKESPVIIGMLHDLCKADLYVPNVNDTWIHNPSPIIKGHGTKSVIYIQHYTNIKLTDEEITCIAYHMGAFTPQEEWSDYTNAVHKYPNVLWTHTADMYASHIYEIKDEQK